MWKEPRSGFLFFIKVKTPHVVTPLFPNSWSPRPLLFSDLCDLANTKSSERFILGGKCLQGNIQNTSICFFFFLPPIFLFFLNILLHFLLIYLMCTCVESEDNFSNQFSPSTMCTGDQTQVPRFGAGPGDPTSHCLSFEDLLLST